MKRPFSIFRPTIPYICKKVTATDGRGESYFAEDELFFMPGFHPNYFLLGEREKGRRKRWNPLQQGGLEKSP